jgi:hypothetical protein
MTTIGFFSAVQKPGETDLTIRSRERQDLVNLKKFIPDMDIIKSPAGSDYAFRAEVTHEEWAEAVAAMALLTDYPNFKDAVKKVNPRRAEVYGRIWGELAAEYGAYGQIGAATRQRATSFHSHAFGNGSVSRDGAE